MTLKDGLGAGAFAKLLERLGDDADEAGERYEDLRRVLLRFFEWRGAPFPEEHADETLNRVARKLDDGVAVENLSAYCYEVARFVFLESIRLSERKGVPLETVDYELAAEPAIDEQDESERRMSCLETCLGTLSPQNRELIIEYYKAEKGRQIDHRQRLAARLGLRRDALGNRAQRLRDKLETCVRRCLKKNS